MLLQLKQYGNILFQQCFSMRSNFVTRDTVPRKLVLCNKWMEGYREVTGIAGASLQRSMLALTHESMENGH